MRYHELALQRWLNRVFILRWGAPVPVVFTSPMDAFATFAQLWSEANNPFQYLLDVKDENGVPCYQPHPAPVRYPVISVYRKGWKLRQYQNFSIHRMRWINWPTVSDTAELHDAGTHQQGTQLTKCNLGEVTTSRYPMAFDYRFQIDHFCNRPDTQSFFLSQLYREFWRTGGTQLQTWIKVSYPGFGDKLVRLYLDGDIDSMTPEEPQEGQNVEFRTSFTVVVEGYDIDLDYKIYPALWKLVLREGSAPPEALNSAFEFTGTVDLREQPENPIVDYRYTTTVMPPPGTCSSVLQNMRLAEAQVHEIQFQSLIVTYPGPLTPPGYPPAAGVMAFGGAALIGGTVTPIEAFGVSPSVLFEGGTHFAVTIEAGTYAESGSTAYSFVSGSHTDTIVSVDSGTEFGTQAYSFDTGTYAEVVVDGGSYYESGSTAAVFASGSHTAWIMWAGTLYESGSQSVGFLNGTHA